MRIRIYETFTSIQGEGTRAGCLCFFIRLAGCNLNCSYCDTAYARSAFSGFDCSVPRLVFFAKFANAPLVEITGGEPLAQRAVPELCRALMNSGFKVLVETNGTLPVSVLPRGVIRIMDCKCPSSGESEKMDFSNFSAINADDEVKFIIVDRRDFDYAVNTVEKFKLTGKTANILFSPAFGKLEPSLLADWIIQSRPPARLQLQLHKYIWGPSKQGV